MAPNWLLALHVVGVILWMGGLFQLTRHLGMHVEQANGEAVEALAAYESKTYYFVVLPGLLLSLGTGLYALFSLGFGSYLASEAWGGTFHLKLMLVAILIAGDQVVRYKMSQLHETGEGNRGFFMAVHGTVGLFFILIAFVVKTRLFTQMI